MDKKIIICLFLVVSLIALSRADAEDEIYDDEYDYIVLGAGTSGSVVASKLSNNRRNSVLLVDEGGYAQHPWIWDPHNWVMHFLIDPEPVISKKFFTPPETGINNRTMTLLRTRVTGGCNTHNGMVVVTGEKYIYDEWASSTNENAWSWNNVRSKHIAEIRSKFYLRKLDENRVLLPELKSSLLRAGVTYQPDAYGGNLQGFSNRISMSKPDNQTYYRRETTYSNYIDPIVANRDNLDVLVYHRAEKIIFSSNGKRARYIRLRDVGTGKVRVIRIKKELILSLGAYESPILLQASGVGDPAKLAQLGVRTNIASPYVGAGLLDHLYLRFAGKPVTANISSGINPSSFERHSISDGFLLFGHRSNTTKTEYVLGLDISPQANGKIHFNCPVELFGTHSVGEVRLRQLDQNGAAVQPLINNNYLSDRRDVDILISGLKECRRIQSQLVSDGILDGTQPELSALGQTDNEMETYVRSVASGDYHPHATIRMGKHSDNKAPLDPQLKLKGSDNIRVVDTSSFPFIFEGNTNVPAIILALQASEFILNDN